MAEKDLPRLKPPLPSKEMCSKKILKKPKTIPTPFGKPEASSAGVVSCGVIANGDVDCGSAILGDCFRAGLSCQHTMLLVRHAVNPSISLHN